MVITFLAFLRRLIEPFRFIARARARKAEERRLEREHQLRLVEALAGTLEIITANSAKQAEESTKGLIEVAHALAAQAGGFAEWIKSFQIASPPTTSVVTEDDEFNAEQLKAAEKLGIAPENLPEEFALAFSLQGNFLSDVKRDARA